MSQPSYTIERATAMPELRGNWDGPVWGGVEALEVGHFYRDKSDHRPTTHAKAVYDDEAVYIHFRVRDRYVRSVHTEYNAMVCRDSCVEFFVQPRPHTGYLNFEVNCGGTLHSSYIEDPTRTPDGFAKFTRVPEEVGGRVRIYHSLPPMVEPEITHSIEWQVEYALPLTVFETYVGTLGPLGGQQWRGNFYKCADECSHPHWGSWSPIEGPLNFHQPQFFAPLRFG